MLDLRLSVDLPRKSRQSASVERVRTAGRVSTNTGGHQHSNFAAMGFERNYRACWILQKGLPYVENSRQTCRCTGEGCWEYSWTVPWMSPRAGVYICTFQKKPRAHTLFDMNNFGPAEALYTRDHTIRTVWSRWSETATDHNFD